MAKQSKASVSKRKLNFIVSEEQKPSVALKAGMRLDVVSVSLVEPTLKPSRARAARLCGGTNTCLALMEVGDLSTQPK
jgi:hypothetical protein